MNNLLNEKWLEALPDSVVEVFQEIVEKIVNTICERIKQIGEMTQSDIQKLTSAYDFIGADMEKVEKAIAEGTQKSKEEIEKIFNECIALNDEYASEFYKYRGMEPVDSFSDLFLSHVLDSIKKQTYDMFVDLSHSTMTFKNGKNIHDMYLQCVDKAIYEVQSGTVDYHTAMRNTIKQLGKGMYRYESGYRRRIDSAVRMNIIDSVKQLNRQIMHFHGNKYGADGVELTTHAISAPDHVHVQGRQFSNEEFARMQSGLSCTDVNGVKYAGFKRPIGQWNCRHFDIPIVIGVSKPTYTNEQLKEMFINSQAKYEITQKQRNYEVTLRSLKDQRLALSSSGDELGAKQLQKKINKLQKEYKSYCSKHDLLYQPPRGSVSGYRRISTKLF